MANQIWQKRVLVPLWVIQLIFVTILLVVFVLAIAVVKDYQDYGEDYGADRLDRPVETAFNVVAGVYAGIAGLTIIWDLIEIILMARRKLSPKVAVTFNAIITTVWLVIFILSIIGAVGTRTAGGLLGIIFILIVLATALGKLIYSSVILHRYRKGLFATRGTYSTPVNAEAGVHEFDPSPSGAAHTAYIPAPVPMNPFRDASREASPAPAQGNNEQVVGSAGRYYNASPSYEMQQTVVR